jgi:pyruvate formate lyase activating enzyme
MDITGTIFDSKEFSVNDGPGVRETVFFKGCPLRCNWCHNPEGWEMRPQLMVRYGECTGCGACRAVCRHDSCTACGECVNVCPGRLRSVCGRVISAAALADALKKNAALYRDMGGGVTFSGGEPLMQPAFLMETMRLLPGVHKAVETCGYAPEDVFRDAAGAADLMMMDVKLADAGLHKKHTGAPNDGILRNLRWLADGGTPFIVRIPLIPGVSDTERNLEATAALLKGAKALRYVELLPYNRLAGAKYESLGMRYRPLFDTDKPVNVNQQAFYDAGIESRVM